MKVRSKFARRVADIEPFRVVEVLRRARELEAEGRDIVHMEAGEPDFATAAPVVEAGREALARGATYYSDAKGVLQLREAIARYYREAYGLDIAAERIMVTPGASGALLLLAALLVDRGDSMLMADPGYPCNRHFLRLVEGEGVLVPVDASHNFQLTAPLIDQYWQPQTIGALVASPANPTGTVLDRQQLSAVHNAVGERGGVLVVDEIYHGLDFGQRAPSILEITDDAFVINSFSKYFGMTGWRLGWLVAPEWALDALEKLAQNLFISMSTMAQFAALRCFDADTRTILNQRRDQFEARCNYLLPELLKLGFDVPAPPAGGLYIYADISRFSNNSAQFCMEMLEQHGLAITPGNDFGHHRAGQYVRFAYTTGLERLELAVQRMKRVLG